MNYWNILLRTMGSKGYVLAADLARELKKAGESTNKAWQAYEKRCKAGELLTYKKGRSQSSRTAYVLPKATAGFERNYPNFQRII